MIYFCWAHNLSLGGGDRGGMAGLDTGGGSGFSWRRARLDTGGGSGFAWRGAGLNTGGGSSGEIQILLNVLINGCNVMF